MKIRNDWFWQLGWLWAMVAFVGIVFGIQWLHDNHPAVLMYGGALVIAFVVITMFVGEIIDSIKE